MAKTPEAEIPIDVDLVRDLLSQQAPDLADLALEPFASGWDNQIFALGDSLLVRLPRREVAVALVRHEHRWLPTLAQRLPLAIPVPIVAGQPSVAFPWPWTVVERSQGLDAISSPPAADRAVAALSGFLNALHVPAPPDAPTNPFRGVPLAARAKQTIERFEALDGWLAARLDVEPLHRAWRRAVDAEEHDGAPMWIHGDIHPGNVIVHDGEIVSIIDFGDLTSGDPATDVGAAWMFFEHDHRNEFRRSLGRSDETWDRARGWALSVSLAIAASSADNPRYEALSVATLERVAADMM